MVISDKQELRRCVKQCVRRASVCEAELAFDVMTGDLGIEAMLDVWARSASSPSESLRRSCADQTPFAPDAVAMFAALDAMNFPRHDLDRAQAMERSYDRSAYIREVLDVMRARCVLVRVQLDQADQTAFDDDRLQPLLDVPASVFAPGRYGVDYAQAAKRISDAAAMCGARNVRLSAFDEQALRYCLLPVCQDAGLSLHIHLKNEEELERFAFLLDAFDGVHALVSTVHDLQRRLISLASRRVRMLVALSDVSLLGEALAMLGTSRIVPYSARTSLPELMLGRWVNARENIWQALCEAYLPLARAGYELQSAAIERDVNRLLCGNLLSLCLPQEV